MVDYMYNSNDTESCYWDPEPKCLSAISEYLPDVTNRIFTLLDKERDGHPVTEEFNCYYYKWLEIQTTFASALSGITNGKLCKPHWDGHICWSYMPADGLETQYCPSITGFKSNNTAQRYCDVTGNWSAPVYEGCLDDEYSLKVKCEQYPDLFCPLDGDLIDEHRQRLAFIQRDIYVYGGIASLILLSIALLIFCCFKSLQCPRVHIHKNLLVSLLLQSILHIIIFEPYISFTNEHKKGEISYMDIPWLCKTLFTLSNYTFLTNIFWAFVEGLFLYSRISIAVFSTETPYWLFYLIGWGIPAAFTLVWALCMHFLHEEQMCWRYFAKYPHFWILMAPILAAALANAVFLVCIIRILVTKLHTAHSAEHVQVRNRTLALPSASAVGKAMKATVVLLPLLSITTLFYIWAPDMEDAKQARTAYRIVNACLQVSQGIFVSVLFCYFNGEVRSAMLKYWNKWRMGSFRYRSSRASSVCVTQSETALWKSSPLTMKRYAAVKTHLTATSTRRQSHSSYLSTDNHYNQSSAPVSAV